MSQDIEAAKTLQRRYRELGRWQAVADELSLNVGLVHQVAHRKTASGKVRRALGLPAQHVSVLPCWCGSVHLRGTCKAGRRIAQRQRSSDPALLAWIQDVVVPFLAAREAG